MKICSVDETIGRHSLPSPKPEFKAHGNGEYNSLPFRSGVENVPKKDS
jgi:hypothetical protein